MSILVVSVTAFLASVITLFSGFGLGTVLLPVFALFVPMPAAIASTAIVHFSNNLFKVGLVGRYADRSILLRFGTAALAGALVGALLLGTVTAWPPLFTYALGGRTCNVLPVKLLIAVLMILFAGSEMLPGLARLTVSPRWLPAGGALSGFFGGLSGHQGALRSAFLGRCGLSPQGFVGTGVVIACAVDVVRLSVYARDLPAQLGRPDILRLLLPGIAAALAGAWLGARLLKKVTVRALQLIVGTLLIVLAGLIGSGLV